MCGIAGVFLQGGADPAWLLQEAQAMTAAIRHRGPDGMGQWLDAGAGIALGHRRLAILDPTSAGTQPFHSPSGRWVITYNGELYNDSELRSRLREAVRFRSHCDTETLAAAIDEWGVAEAVRRAEGMFAFAAFDRRERSLTLVRDRFGEKPLLYGTARAPGGRPCLLFASEMKGLEASSVLDRELEPGSEVEFLRRGYIGAPRTVYRAVRKLPPAHLLETGMDPQCYWQPESLQPKPLDHREASEAVEAQLGRAVRSRLAADVPLGLFLSGGVDSSLIASYLPGRRAFSIGFAESAFDESAVARQVAQAFDISLRVERLTAAEAQAVIPRLAAIYDEPFADSSQIATVLLTTIASTEVKVALTGDGGDELFDGYPRYRQMEFLARAPRILRRIAAPAVALRGDEKSTILAELLPAADLSAMYQALMGEGPVPPWPDRRGALALHDLAHYLPDDLMVKMDRAAMHIGLETRSPFLDTALLRVAFSLPPELRRGKAILRRLLARKLPGAARLPKRGFRVPLAQWLRGPLREWAEDMVPGTTAGLPPGDRCTRAWNRLMWAAWQRDRTAAGVVPAAA